MAAFSIVSALGRAAVTNVVPAAVQSIGGDVSRWMLVAAIAAIGMKTQLKDVAGVGLRPIMLMMGETLFLAALVLASQHWMP